MKKILSLLFLIVLFLVSGVFKSGSVSSQADGDNIIISWETDDESNVKQFIIERSSDEFGNFSEIVRINANGSKKYSYIDRSVFKTTVSTFVYKLTPVSSTGVAVEQSVVTKKVYLKVSSVKRTWGSLKAMFR
ncbi:MAG: hypothetical protein Q8L88_16710 [Bacteroidota bacterium]|nr:hypothetical protein [Bacteroidota bacterium]